MSFRQSKFYRLKERKKKRKEKGEIEKNYQRTEQTIGQTKKTIVNETKARHYLCESVVKNVKDLTHLFPRATMEAFVQFAYGKRHEQLVVHEFFLWIVTPAIRVKNVAFVRRCRATSSARTHWTNAHRPLHLHALHAVFHPWHSTSARGKHPAACTRTRIVFYVARDISTYNNICRLRVVFFLSKRTKLSRASLLSTPLRCNDAFRPKIATFSQFWVYHLSI